MKKTLVLMVIALAVPVGCTRSPGKLDRPWYLLNFEDGLCGSTVAVDGNGTIWREGGCESGGMNSLRASGSTTEAQLNRVRESFEALPPSSSTDAGCSAGSEDGSELGPYSFGTLWKVADDDEDKWEFCGDIAPEWATDAVEAMDSL